MNKKYFDQLVEHIISLKNSQELIVFLKGILTPAELDEISTRLQIVKLIKEGLTHREIAVKLKVGIATVTRGSKEITKNRL